MQILGGNGKRNYYKGRASGNAGGQERSNSLLSVSPATTLTSQEKWFSGSEFPVIAEFVGNSFSNHSLMLAKSHTLPKTHNKSRVQARKQLWKFLRLLFFLLSAEQEWASFWFQPEKLKDSPRNSQLGKDIATFTVHLRCSGTPHLYKASQKPPVCRVNMPPLVTRFYRGSRNGFLWSIGGWGHAHCLQFSLGWCTFSLKVECFGFLFVLCYFYVCFEIEFLHVAEAGLTLAIPRLQLTKLWNPHSPLRWRIEVADPCSATCPRCGHSICHSLIVLDIMAMLSIQADWVKSQ